MIVLKRRAAVVAEQFQSVHSSLRLLLPGGRFGLAFSRTASHSLSLMLVFGLIALQVPDVRFGKQLAIPMPDQNGPELRRCDSGASYFVRKRRF
jgi:hypothetical protein